MVHWILQESRMENWVALWMHIKDFILDLILDTWFPPKYWVFSTYICRVLVVLHCTAPCGKQIMGYPRTKYTHSQQMANWKFAWEGGWWLGKSRWKRDLNLNVLPWGWLLTLTSINTWLFVCSNHLHVKEELCNGKSCILWV